jgi:hypothetical protein
LNFWDLEVVVIDQVKTFPIFLEVCQVFVYVVIFFGGGMPEVLNNSNGGFLTFVLIDSFKVVTSCMGRRRMLNMNEWFICNFLGN